MEPREPQRPRRSDAPPTVSASSAKGFTNRQGRHTEGDKVHKVGPPQRDRPKPKAAYLGAPGYVGTPGTTAANAGPSTGPSTGRTSPTASDGARTRAVSPTRARQDDGAAPPPPMTTPPPVPPPDTPSPPPRRPGRSQKRLPPPPGNPSLPHPPRGAKKGPSQGGVAAPPPPGTTPPARPPRRSETRPPASTSSSAAPSNGAAHGLEGHVPATSPAPRDGAPNGAAAPAGTSGTTANGLASTAAAPGSSTGASGAGSTSGEASGTADGSTGAAANGMGPNGETATGADGAGSNNGGASGGADGTAASGGADGTAASGGADGTAASGPTPDGEATRTAGGSPSRVTRKEGETDTKKLKRRGSRNKPSAGLVAGIHRDRIKKAVEEGMNKVTRKKEKGEKSTTKDEVAAAIANMPPEVVKWTSKDGVGNVMCQGTRCRHPSRFLAGKPVLIRHQPSVNVGGRTATHDTYYHWKCTTREQRVRFKAPGSINVSHLLNARDRLEIEWDIANAVKRKNPAPQTTEGNHNKTVAKKRRRRDSIKHEAKKAKRAERAERKAEKGKQRAKAQETDLPSESEDDDDMDGDNANGSDDDKSQSSDSMEASPRRSEGSFMEAYRTHDGEGMAAAHSRLQLGLGGRLLGNEANLQGSLSSHSPSAHFQDDRSVRGTPGEDDNEEVQNTVSLGDGEEEQ
ncbi:hypothetical protein B0H21DRAFT_819457 [Amylocystis lapponica]|nr:hypothetical protein B0H21DRAFT_819457 [Amylocystis lapponica]